MAEVVEVLVPGGRATPGPPLGPALGPLGVNVKAVVDKINEKTAEFEGMQVPVKVIVQPDGSFEIEVGVPPTTALIKKELGIEKGSGETPRNVVGNLSFEQVIKIAEIKREKMLANSLKSACKEVVGACQSMGVTIDGKTPKEVMREIEEGKYDHFFENR
ncbi:MAG: large subunit ribosomal protein [Archaeoglobi archaeon]|nr:50S ribosomal protein L11 [Candidatus Mnemosynella bozhongmuii]MDI3502475.1 large subunit ribosomal protein [Archaeoglobi archaeon]MDK2781931.1 large subunit ribosomal protein [Archaeoglobi archaeon]